MQEGGDPCGYSALNLMAQEAALIFSLAFEVRELYELKALNKSKVKSLTDAVDQICEYLQTHYSLIVAECPGHLIRLEVHVRAASDWCKSYVKSSSFSKTFNSNINGKRSDELRSAMMGCFQILAADVGPRVTSLLIASNARPVPEVPFGLPVQGDEPPMGIPVANAEPPLGTPVASIGSRAPNHPPLRMQHEFLDSAQHGDWDKVMRMAERSPALINAHPTGDRPPYTVRWSALHHAAEQGRPIMIEWLLQKGASPALQNQMGQLPIDVIGRNGTEAERKACHALLSTIRAPGVQSSFVPRFSFDLGELGIHPGVDVHLRSCITRGAVLSASEDRYELTGPTAVVNRLTEILGQSDVGNIGFLAPRAQVNLDPASRREAGVPENAVFFRFVYPPRGMTGTISEAVVDEICRDGLHESWLHFIILGGFAYYGGDGSLIQLNALTKGDSGPYRLCFGEPRSVPASLVSQLKRDGRMQAISLPALLCEGAAGYSWVNPDPERYQLGGFVYEANPSLAEHGGSGPPSLGFEVIPSTDPLLPQRTPSEAKAAELGIPVEEVRASLVAQQVLEDRQFAIALR